METLDTGLRTLYQSACTRWVDCFFRYVREQQTASLLFKMAGLAHNLYLEGKQRKIQYFSYHDFGMTFYENFNGNVFRSNGASNLLIKSGMG